MEMNLEDRKVLITGAGEGIGRALAVAFANEGARIAGCARTPETLDSLEQELAGQGPEQSLKSGNTLTDFERSARSSDIGSGGTSADSRHFFKPADLSKSTQISRFYRDAVKSMKGLDILINNVGSIGKLAPFMKISDKEWQEAFDINLMSAVRLCRLCIPDLKKSEAPCIINISSIAGNRPGDVFPHYAAMKAGMSNLTVSLAQTLAEDGIRVNTVAPGPVWTRSWSREADEAAKQSGMPAEKISLEMQRSTGETVPLKRMGLPEDVTGLVLFLASSNASWITGSHFTVDGGIVRNPY